MGELLAGLLEGLLEGLFGSVLGDLSASVIGRLVRFSLCGEEGSRFLIQRADAMRGPEGLRRETVRRRRMRWEFGLLLFFMAVEVFFWILTLFVRNESDFTLRIRKYGFPVFAGTAMLPYSSISSRICGSHGESFSAGSGKRRLLPPDLSRQSLPYTGTGMRPRSPRSCLSDLSPVFSPFWWLCCGMSAALPPRCFFR